MTAYKGNLVLLKIGDGGTPQQFVTIGGMRTARMSVNRQVVAAGDVLSDGWRRALAGCGRASVRIQGDGVFTGSAGEQRLREKAMTGAVADFRLFFGNGDRMEAGFVVAGYERSGKAGDFVVVDDLDLVSNRSGSPLAPLVEFLPQGRDLGLHLIVARRTGGAARAMYEPLLQTLSDTAVPAMLFSGDRMEGRLANGVASRRLPPGRALLARRGRSPEQVQAPWSAPAE